MARLGFLLWVALLAFGLPEVFAGTGANWPLRPDVFILGIPLYALHFLLLCHLAVKTERTSWSALFQLGIIFGLYETWVTKVVWAGYPGVGGFAMGGFGPWFGLHETIGLILFYHAVTSFLLPLAVLTRLFPAYASAFPAPDWIFGNSRWASLRRIGLALIFGVVSGFNMPEPSLYLISWVPMILLLVFGYRLLKNTHAANPMLGPVGLWVAGIWLLALYIASFLLLRTEAIPPVSALVITIGIYSVVAVLFWRLPQQKRPNIPAETGSARMPFIWLLIVFIIGLLTSIGMSAGIEQVAFMAALPFVAMVPLGAGLFLWLVVWRAIVRRH